MKTKLKLASSALSPSGTGTEWFSIKRLPDTRTPAAGRWLLRFSDDNSFSGIEIEVDDRTLTTIFATLSKAVAGAQTP